MEEMYNDYKDVAEFRMIYIREAHAADSNRPTATARRLEINEAQNYGDRCETAQRLIEDKSLTMPMLIDNMDNGANLAYSAHPDRVFLVRSDGRLAVAADRGPFGFGPALDDARDWLEKLSDTGKEPALTEQQIKMGDQVTKKKAEMAAAKKEAEMAAKKNSEAKEKEMKKAGSKDK